MNFSKNEILTFAKNYLKEIKFAMAIAKAEKIKTDFPLMGGVIKDTEVVVSILENIQADILSENDLKSLIGDFFDFYKKEMK